MGFLLSGAVLLTVLVTNSLAACPAINSNFHIIASTSAAGGQNGFYGYLDFAPRLAFTANISEADTFRVDSKQHLYGGGNNGDNYAQTYYGFDTEYGIIFENNNSSAVASKLVAQTDGSCHLVLSPTFDTTSTKLYQCAGCSKGVHCAWFNSVRQAHCGALQLVVESAD